MTTAGGPIRDSLSPSRRRSADKAAGLPSQPHDSARGGEGESVGIKAKEEAKAGGREEDEDDIYTF